MISLMIVGALIAGQAKNPDPRLQKMNGNFQALRDMSTLAKIDSLSEQDRRTFSGNLFVLDPRGPRHTGFIKRHYDKGHIVTAQDTFTPLKGENPSMVEFLKSVPKGTDMRVCPENFQRFPVKLPGEAYKLERFTGTLREERGFALKALRVIKLKNGMISR